MTATGPPTMEVSVRHIPSAGPHCYPTSGTRPKSETQAYAGPDAAEPDLCRKTQAYGGAGAAEPDPGRITPRHALSHALPMPTASRGT